MARADLWERFGERRKGAGKSPRGIIAQIRVAKDFKQVGRGLFEVELLAYPVVMLWDLGLQSGYIPGNAA